MTGVMQAIIGSIAGGAPGTVTLNSTYNPVATGSGVQVASFALESDGDIAVNGSDVGDWLDPKASAPSLYEVRATIVSGSLTSGTAGSWLALSTTRTWTRTDPANDGITEICVLTIEIRYNGGPVLATSTVTLEASRTG